MDKELRKIEINAICKISRALALDMKGDIFERIVKETVQEAINYAHSCETLPSKEEIDIEASKRAKYIAPTNATPLVSHRRSFRLGAEFVINHIRQSK